MPETGHRMESPPLIQLRPPSPIHPHPPTTPKTVGPAPWNAHFTRKAAHLRASLISVKCFLLFTFFGFVSNKTNGARTKGRWWGRANCKWATASVYIVHTYINTVSLNRFGVDFYLSPVTWPVWSIMKYAALFVQQFVHKRRQNQR